MTSEEQAERIGIVVALYDALGRHLTDMGASVIVRATEKMPFPWLRDACLELAASWDESQRNPGAPAIFRTAARLAGFQARRCKYDYFDPAPDTVRWWPPASSPVGEQLAQSWAERPESVQRAIEAQCGGAPLLPSSSFGQAQLGDGRA